MTVTDEMIEAAEKVYWDTERDPEGSRDMRAALHAALELAPRRPPFVHVGYQWRGRPSTQDLWSMWRDGPCPAIVPKGSETEERRIFAMAEEPTHG